MAADDSLWRRLDAALGPNLLPSSWDGEEVTVLFSGGLDSGLLAWELRRRASTQLFTIGRAGTADPTRARAASEVVGLPWSWAEVTDVELAELDRELAPAAPAEPRARRAIHLALAAAIVRAPSARLVFGQGADELFLGYAHFRGLTGERARARSDSDLAQAQLDWKRAIAYAEAKGRELWAPFLSAPMIAAAQSIPIETRLPGWSGAKPVLRGWARSRGLPEALAGAPKHAIQYGTGVDRWLRARAGDKYAPPGPLA